MSAGPLPFKWASAAYALLFALALVAFWPGYLAAPKAEMSAWMHLHAITATLWIFMLIAQPLAIVLISDFYKWGAIRQFWKSLAAGFAGVPIP